MIILYNPEDGADIKDVWFQGTKYFNSENGEAFKPGMVLQLDDVVADFMHNTFGFLQEIDFAEAKKYMERVGKDYPCEECKFVTRSESAFVAHKQKHEIDKRASELGIPVIKRGVSGIQTPKKDSQENIDQEATAAGLDQGEGLVIEKPKKAAVMR